MSSSKHQLTYPKSTANKVNRYNHQATYDTLTIHKIINETPVVHVSFVSKDGLPVVLPMIGQLGSFDNPSASLSDPLDLYLHGYVSARIMNLSRGADPPMPICVCATKVDGLVLTLTPNTHNYNYRSAIIHGTGELVVDNAEKLWAMELITNSVVPGRWKESRLPPDEAEMSSTQILKVNITSASAKVREGVPNDENKDLQRDDVLDTVWTGVIPLYEVLGDPIVGPYNRVPNIPEHVTRYVKERNEQEENYAIDAANKPAPEKR